MKTKKEKVKPNWLDPSTTAETEVLPRYVKWAWSSRGLSMALNAVLALQLTFYLTDILGLDAATVGMLFLVSKIFDGFTDLIIGFIIDHTHTRFGKARPYEICVIFVWLFTVMLFSAPSGMSTTATYAYVFVLYILINSIFATALNGSDAVYLSRAIRNEQNRVKIMSFNGTIIMIFSMVVSILMPQLVAGIGTTRAGWRVIALSFGIPCGIIGIFRFLFVKEVVHEKPENGTGAASESIPFKTSLKCLVKNKYIFILAGISICSGLVSNIGSSVSTYYYKYIVGNIGLASVVTLASAFTPLLIIFMPLLTRKISMTKILKISMVFTLAGYAIRTIGGTALPTLCLGGLLTGIGALPLSLMINIYLIDCMDYGEWKTGIRVEGVLTSLNSFSGKVASGVASSLVGVIMGMAGYDGSLAVQSAAANQSIVLLFNWLPLILTAVELVLSLFYDIDKKLPQIHKDLAARHAAKKEAEA